MPNPWPLWLSMDLSTRAGSLAIHESTKSGMRLLAKHEMLDGGRHAESLIAGVECVLETAGLSLSSIDRFLTSSGPGSFTGLRIAFASLKAFAQATGKPVDTVNGHEVRALHYLQTAPTKGKIWVVTRLTRDILLSSCFEPDPEGGLVLVEENQCASLPTVDGPVLTEESHPLHACQIAETLALAKSREVLETWPAIAAASPRYFGSRVY